MTLSKIILKIEIKNLYEEEGRLPQGATFQYGQWGNLTVLRSLGDLGISVITNKELLA